MNPEYLVLILFTAVLSSSCTLSPQVKADTTGRAQATRSSTEGENSKKEIAKKESQVGSETVGKPAAGTKFSKLKIGMTLNQVENLIGPPAKQWKHPTNKVSIPFYFGPDRWVIQYSYKREGELTLNAGGDQLLTHIEVNKAE